MKSFLAAALAVLSAACSEAPPADPRAELAALIARPASPEVSGRIVSFRTEPTASPSHSAVIEARYLAEVYRLQAFRKDGTWHYDSTLSLTDGGTDIHLGTDAWISQRCQATAAKLNLQP